MKTIYICIFLFFFSLPSWAQQVDPLQTDSLKRWKINGDFLLSFNQVGLQDWAGGGESSYSLSGLFNLNMGYSHKRHSWNTSLQLAYGVLKSGNNSMEKNQDIIELNSGYSYFLKKRWYLSAFLHLRTQFAPGYDVKSEKLISNFLAPLYIIPSVGIEYKIKDMFSFYISPLVGKVTIVKEESLANEGAFGVKSAEYDLLNIKMRNGTNNRIEFGAFAKVAFKKEVFENVSLQSQLTLFNNYTDPKVSNRGNVDVNFDLQLILKVNSFLNANFSFNMIYDDDILLPNYENQNGVEVEVSKSPKLQLKEVLGIGLTFKF